MPKTESWLEHGDALQAVIEYRIKSEYATLKFLERTSVPAPRAFGYGLRCGGPGADHGVGVSFILMEELPGRPWYGGGEPPEDEETKRKEERLFAQLADVLAELARWPFDKAGSLTVREEEGARKEKGGGGGDRVEEVVVLGPQMGDRFAVLDPEGPYETAEDYYAAWAEQHLELIADGQLYTEYPVDAYLTYRFLADNVGQMLEEPTKGKKKKEQFFLKHIDDNGQHILVDDDYNITGIIDWEYARTVPRHEAFGASTVTAEMDALYNREWTLPGLSVRDRVLIEALENRGSPELARLICDERARRLFWGLALEPTGDGAERLANEILKAFGVKETWDEWREEAIRRYSDKRLRRLLRREKARAVKSEPYHLRSLAGKQGRH